MVLFVMAACAPARLDPYVGGSCPLPPGVHGYPVMAHDESGTLPAALLQRVAESVAERLGSPGPTVDDSIPPDLQVVDAMLQRGRPHLHFGFNPSPADTATVVIEYRGPDSAATVRLSDAGSPTGAFAARALRAVRSALASSARGDIEADTFPVTMPAHATVLVRFGRTPASGDAVARLAAQERTAAPSAMLRPPQYPPVERAMGQAGAVRLALVVRADGRVDPAAVRVLQSTDVPFTNAVLEAVRDYQYIPAQVNCAPVASVAVARFTFEVDHD